MTSMTPVDRLLTQPCRRPRRAPLGRGAGRSDGSRGSAAPPDVTSARLPAGPCTGRDEHPTTRDYGFDAASNLHALEWRVIGRHMQPIDPPASPRVDNDQIAIHARQQRTLARHAE